MNDQNEAGTETCDYWDGIKAKVADLCCNNPTVHASFRAAERDKRSREDALSLALVVLTDQAICLMQAEVDKLMLRAKA